MGGPRYLAWGSLTLLGIAAAVSAGAAHADAAVDWRARVSAKLLSIYDAAARGRTSAPSGGSSASTAPSAPGYGASPFLPHIDTQGRVQVDVHYDCSLAAPVGALAAAGLSVDTSVHVPPLCVVEGWIAPSGLPSIASAVGVSSVTVPRYALPPHAPPTSMVAPAGHSAPRLALPHELPRSRAQPSNPIDGSGVTIMRADQFVSQTGTSGTGVTVGVQSTGVASLSVIQQRGELPVVRVLTPTGETSPPAADEGTALLEEVHAVAPGASLAFCGPETFVEYTSCLQQLISAGATILADDVIFVAEDPMSVDGTDTQAIQQILTANPGVALFTVVGNANGSYWEGDYAPVTLSSQGLSPLSCPTGSGTQIDSYVAQFSGSASQQLNVTSGATFPLMFAWGDPPTANVSNFDVYWSNNADPTQSGCFSTAGTAGNNITPTLSLEAGTYTLYVATPDASLAGKFLKLWIGGDGLTFISAPTPGGIVSAQAYVPGAVTIGAVNGSDGVGDSIETFSAQGPLSLVFPSPTTVPAPLFVAPDGIYVDAQGTYFEDMLFPDGNFYGTSASVPNAAAVFALLRADFPSLSVAQLLSSLEAGATQLGSGVPNDTFGYGRIDALGALETLPGPTITALPSSATIDAGTSTAAFPFAITGTGALHFKVTSSDAGLVPPSVVAAGSPGVTISPAACGVSTSSCTVTVTAAAGPGGTTEVTLDALDGANRSASASMQITVNGSASSSAPPASASTPTSSGGGGGGGALGWGTLAALALLAARRARTCAA